MSTQPKIDWPSKDARLLQLRAQGLTFSDIGKLLDIGADTARKRWWALNGRTPNGRPEGWRPSSDLIRMRQTCADAFGITDDQITGGSRVRPIAHVRQAVGFIIRSARPNLSYPCIAVVLGLNDHSTVIHGQRATLERIRRDPTFAGLVMSLIAMFSSRADVRQHDSHVLVWREYERLAFQRAADAAAYRKAEAARLAEAEAAAALLPEDEFEAARDARRTFCHQCDRSVLAAEAARCSQRLCGLRAREAA